jgi:hypothetical protein
LLPFEATQDASTTFEKVPRPLTFATACSVSVPALFPM